MNRRRSEFWCASVFLVLAGCGKGNVEQPLGPETVSIPLTGITVSEWSYDELHQRVAVLDQVNGKIVFVNIVDKGSVELDTPNILDMDLRASAKILAAIYKKDDRWVIGIYSTNELQPQLLNEIAMDATLDPKQIVVKDDKHFIVGLLDDRDYRRLATFDITQEPPQLNYFGKEDIVIAARNEARSHLYSISYPDRRDWVEEWDIASEKIVSIASARLFNDTAVGQSMLTENGENSLLFAVTQDGGNAYGGRIPVYKTNSFDPAGALNLEWQPIAFAVTPDDSRGIAAHADYVINATELSSHDVRIADIHIFDLRKPDYPLLGTYELPAPVVTNGLMVTASNEILAMTKTGDLYQLVVVKP